MGTEAGTTGKKSGFWSTRLIIAGLAGVATVATLSFPLVMYKYRHELFPKQEVVTLQGTNYRPELSLEQEVVTLQGTVLNEKYTPASDCFFCGLSRSEYSISLIDSVQGRVGIEVLATPDVNLETIDAVVGRGVNVEVKARKVGPHLYQAFADDVKW